MDELSKRLMNLCEIIANSSIKIRKNIWKRLVILIWTVFSFRKDSVTTSISNQPINDRRHGADAKQNRIDVTAKSSM